MPMVMSQSLKSADFTKTKIYISREQNYYLHFTITQIIKGYFMAK